MLQLLLLLLRMMEMDVERPFPRTNHVLGRLFGAENLSREAVKVIVLRARPRFIRGKFGVSS
jgi:hypothetical protein